VRRADTALAVYVDESGKATLSWQVTIMTASPLGQWRYFVNARRPVVVHRFDSIAEGKRRRATPMMGGQPNPGGEAGRIRRRATSHTRDAPARRRAAPAVHRVAAPVTTTQTRKS
jgi:hypothetical protein